MPEVRLKPAVASQGRSGAAPTNPRQTGPKARMTVSRGNAWVRFLGRVGGTRTRPSYTSDVVLCLDMSKCHGGSFGGLVCGEIRREWSRGLQGRWVARGAFEAQRDHAGCVEAVFDVSYVLEHGGNGRIGCNERRGLGGEVVLCTRTYVR